MRRRLGRLVLVLLAAVACACVPRPKTFVNTKTRPASWAKIAVNPELTRDVVWEAVVDTLSHRLQLAVVEKDSGYVSSFWGHPYVARDQVRPRYRVQCAVKLLEAWAVAEVKCEAHWEALYGDDWSQGYDKQIWDEVYGGLRDRIGKKAR